MGRGLNLREQRIELGACFRTTEDRRLRDRCQAVLMVARGRPLQQVAEDLGTTVRNVQRFLARYREGCLEGLRIQWTPSKKPLIPEELAPTTLDWVRKGPGACGLERQLDARSPGRFPLPTDGHSGEGDSHGVRPYWSTCRILCADAARQQRAREELSEKNSRPSEATLSC
jgi:DNA-binding CsgD family transcriptional regulator